VKTRMRNSSSGYASDWVEDRRSRRVAHLGGVSGWVAVGPRKAAVPSGRVEGAGACLEAEAFLVAGQTVPRLVRPTDRSFDYFLDRGTPGAGVLLPGVGKSRVKSRVLDWGGPPYWGDR
jgi:hypothetical protein